MYQSYAKFQRSAATSEKKNSWEAASPSHPSPDRLGGSGGGLRGGLRIPPFNGGINLFSEAKKKTEKELSESIHVTRAGSWTNPDREPSWSWTELIVKPGPDSNRELSWTNWTERTGSQPDQAGELNWSNSFKTILNWICVTPTPRHTPDKQEQPAKRTIPQHWRQTPGRRAGISAGGIRTAFHLPNNLALEMDWTEPEPKRASQVNPSRAVKWTEGTERRHMAPCPELNWTSFPDKLVNRNWAVLNWCQTILNFEREYLVSSRTLLALHVTMQLPRNLLIAENSPVINKTPRWGSVEIQPNSALFIDTNLLLYRSPPHIILHLSCVILTANGNSWTACFSRIGRRQWMFWILSHLHHICVCVTASVHSDHKFNPFW